MSGNSRVCRSTEGSMFLACACAAALSSTADKAERPISKAGMADADIESGMRGPPLFHPACIAGMKVHTQVNCLNGNYSPSLGSWLSSLHFCQPALVKPDKVDRVKHQWREAAVDD